MEFITTSTFCDPFYFCVKEIHVRLRLDHYGHTFAAHSRWVYWFIRLDKLFLTSKVGYGERIIGDFFLNYTLKVPPLSFYYFCFVFCYRIEKFNTSYLIYNLINSAFCPVSWTLYLNEFLNYFHFY